MSRLALCVLLAGCLDGYPVGGVFTGGEGPQSEDPRAPMARACRDDYVACVERGTESSETCGTEFMDCLGEDASCHPDNDICRKVSECGIDPEGAAYCALDCVGIFMGFHPYEASVTPYGCVNLAGDDCDVIAYCVAEEDRADTCPTEPCYH